MTKSGRFVAILVLMGALVLAFGLPLLATEESGETETPPDTTVVTTDIEPAVEVTLPPESTATADWTYRYLIPTGIGLAILVILVTSGQYFTSVVRKRYRIVEE
ncbi:MAG: hypothetical protein OEM32_11220 [Acidimicrobiia bacterium]|nr:hypothetical protein [Acidimicrobiia bacterium]